MLCSVKITVIVYRAETYYFAHMYGWRAGLVSQLTKKYWDSGYHREHEENFEFASDERVDHFWRDLDAEHLSERFTLTVDADASTTSLLSLAMQRAQAAKPAGIGHESLYGLFHLESGAEIEEARQLKDYNIEDGDHFGLIIEFPALAFYRLIPLPDAEMVLAAIRSADAEPPTSDLHVRRDMIWGDESTPDSGRTGLRGALLYTDEDPAIATYVRKHFASLSEGSGPNLLFYVIEQPESDWREASRYWKGVIDEQLQREWVTLGWLRTKPYKPEQAYEVARQLGVYPDELPCLVLFERMSDSDKLVFPLLDGSAAYFRKLFGLLQRLILPGKSSELTFSGVRREYGSIVKELNKLAKGTTVTDRIEYSFEGQTVFINNPSGPVTLSDFQKQSISKETGS
jgi:hypothetical protein